jgi:hypothetical protein
MAGKQRYFHSLISRSGGQSEHWTNHSSDIMPERLLPTTRRGQKMVDAGVDAGVKG